MTTNLTVALALVAAAAVAAVAACGSHSATHSTTSSVAGTTSSAGAASPAAPSSLAAPGCPLTVQAVAAAIGTVFRGPVKLDDIPGSVECTYQVDDDRWLHIRASPYTANRKATISVNQATAEYGGTSARQVFTSTASAFQKVAQAGGTDRGFAQYPDIGAGLVTNGVGGFVLAGAKDVWYSGDFGIFTNRDYNVVAMNVAKALAAL
jgi:hypothetical protein